MRRLILPLLVATASLSGCMSQTKYDGVQEMFRGSPAARERVMEKCVQDKKLSEYERQDVAAAINVPADANVERTLCRRFMNAMSSGRMTYEDYNSMLRGEINPKTMRIIQGR